MKRIVIFLSALFLLLSPASAQNDTATATKQINSIKMSSDYIFAESTATTEQEAKDNARLLLEVNIEEWIKSKQSDAKDIQGYVAKAGNSILEVKTTRGNRFRVFLYVRKNDIMTFSDATEIIAAPMQQESQQTVDAGHGHGEIYAVEYKTAGRNKDATEYFRVNPHRLNLGCLGLVFSDAKGNTLNLSSISGISQVLKLWEGIVESDYTVSDSPVKVVTGSNGDALLARIVTPLFAKRQARLALRLPYPTGKHSDDASDWASVERHTSRIVSSTSQHALIEHRIDDTRYFVSLRWNGRATLSNTSSHVFTLTPLDNIIDVAVSYSSSEKGCATSPLTLDSELQACRKRMETFWQSGAFADFSLCTDPRAKDAPCSRSMSPTSTAEQAACLHKKLALPTTRGSAVHTLR